MPRYFLTLSYNGANYNGWQVQENTPNTIEQVLEEKISMILKEKIDLVGCGRTDTRVSAKNFVAHFDSKHKDLIENKKHWIYKFNTVLPPSIAVSDIQQVKEEAHARYDAQERVYFYFLHRKKNPFIEDKSWYLYGDLDFEKMNEAAQLLLEYKDFSCFSKAHTGNKTNFCKINKAVWQKVAEEEWRFTIKADRFLRGMVRAIVGSLVLVGKNKMSLKEFRKVIEGKERAAAGANSPAHALFLTGIKYPKEIYLD
jgi:tRNA pseudouridine38-40 synthase